jgi:radical SAM protein with 4Fe4S-binding SPASM domain
LSSTEAQPTTRQRTLQEFLSSKRAPVIVYLELTLRCSFLCKHCYIPAKSRWPEKPDQVRAGELSTEEIFKLLDELKRAGTLFLVLTGGEIFLRPDLMQITERATELGFVVKFYSNGFHLTDELAKKMKDLGVYAVEISIYGASEKTYQEVTKIRGGYKRVMQSIGYLREHGVRTILKTPVMRLNVADIHAIKAMSNEMKLSLRYDFVIVPGFNGDKTPLSQRCSDEQISQALKELGAKFTTNDNNDSTRTSCAVGKWSAVVDPIGDVYPCIELRQKIGNVREQSFDQVWQNNPHMRKIRQILADAPANEEAFEDGICGHCPAFSLHEQGDMNTPAQEQLRLANIKRNLAPKERINVES